MASRFFNAASQQYAVCGSAASLANLSAFTLAFHGYRASSSDKLVFGSRDLATGASALLQVLDPGFGLLFNVSHNTGGLFGQVASFSATGHLFMAFVFDGAQSGDANRVKGYVNGVQQSLSFTGAMPSTTYSILPAPEIGRDATFVSLGLGGYSTGKISHCQLFQRALAYDELEQIRHRPGSLPTFGYWPLFGADSPEPDLSGNGNHATLVNAPANDPWGPPVQGLRTARSIRRRSSSSLFQAARARGSNVLISPGVI